MAVIAEGKELEHCEHGFVKGRNDLEACPEADAGVDSKHTAEGDHHYEEVEELGDKTGLRGERRVMRSKIVKQSVLLSLSSIHRSMHAHQSTANDAQPLLEAEVHDETKE